MLKKGEIFEAEVIDLASDGQAVVKHESGITCFSLGLWLGERGRFRVSELKRTYAHLELLEITRKSEDRREAPCSYASDKAGACGGCTWMFINYSAQLLYKQERVKLAIGRLNSSWQNRVTNIVGSDEEFAYRNRVQLKSDSKRLGFFEAKSHRLVDIEHCAVLVHPLNKSLNILRQSLPNKAWVPRAKHKWVTIDIDDEISPNDLDPEIITINQRLPFRQANDAQNRKMRGWLRDTIASIISKGYREHETIKCTELFCGAGNFTSVLSEQPQLELHVAECTDVSVEKIKNENWFNGEAYTLDLFDEAQFKGFLKRCKGMDILVLDPPRDGFKVKSGLFVKSVAPKHVVYISCDLATFIRDLAEFAENGYELKTLTPIDLFPQTPHIELMAHIVRK